MNNSGLEGFDPPKRVKYIKVKGKLPRFYRKLETIKFNRQRRKDNKQ